MKKFRRVFLIISGILAILGIILIIAGVSMGGTKAIASDLLNNHLSINFSDVFSMDSEKYDSMGKLIGEENIFEAKDIKSIELIGNAGEFEITLWDRDAYNVQVIKGLDRIRFSLENGVLSIASEEKNLIAWGETVKAKIYIPRDAILENATLSIGAGELLCNNINATTLDVNVGAGECVFTNVQATNAKINVGAGDGEINNATFNECELKVGIGDLDLNGNISGNVYVDCGVGNIELDLTNVYEDFDYAVNVGAGDVELGNEKYAGVSNSVNLTNDSDKLMNIKCGMGDVSVDFGN